MTTSDNNKKGFGGFDELVSDVSKEVEALAPKAIPRANKPTPELPREIPQASSSEPIKSPSPVENTNSTNTPRGSSGSDWIWWVIGSFFIIAIVINAGDKSDDKSSSTTTDQRTYVPDEAVPAAEVDIPDPAQEPIAPEGLEEIPPVGNGLVLSRNQIRYCLSEKVRLGVINDTLNSNSEFEVDSFNAAVNYYNSRCSSYKYRQGLLESVQSEVSLNRSTLVIEGLRTLERWRGQAPRPVNIDPSVSVNPPVTVSPPVNSAPSNKNRPTYALIPEPQSSDYALPETSIPEAKRYSNLFAAVQSGDIEATEQMLSEGANINPVEGAHPPLIAAIYTNNIAMVELLLNHGANPNSRNSRGESAILIAKTLKNPNAEIIDRLYQAGATNPFSR